MVITVPDVLISEDEYATVAAQQWLSRPKYRWPLWVYGLSALVMLLVAAMRLWARAQNPAEPWPVFELVWVALIGFYALWWRRQRLEQHYRKSYRSSAQAQAPSTYRFGEDSVENVSTLGQSTLRYAALTKAVVRGKWLLLYFSDHGFAFVDLTRVQSPATPEDLLGLLRRQGVAVE
jgi:hypothetical protein